MICQKNRERLILVIMERFYKPWLTPQQRLKLQMGTNCWKIINKFWESWTTSSTEDIEKMKSEIHINEPIMSVDPAPVEVDTTFLKKELESRELDISDKVYSPQLQDIFTVKKISGNAIYTCQGACLSRKMVVELKDYQYGWFNTGSREIDENGNEYYRKGEVIRFKREDGVFHKKVSPSNEPANFDYCPEEDLSNIINWDYED